MFYSDHDDGEIQTKFGLDLDSERSTIFRTGWDLLGSDAFVTSRHFLLTCTVNGENA